MAHHRTAPIFAATLVLLLGLPPKASASPPPLADGGLTGPGELGGRGPLYLALGGGDPCEGNNHADDEYLDGVSMGGPMVALEWIPTLSVDVTRVEVFTGEGMGLNAVGIWSDDGGAPSRPLAALGYSAPFAIDVPNTWYGADLNVTVPVVAGSTYWVVWDPAGGEQCGCTDNPADIQQTYYGTNVGDVSGGAGWELGPFSFADRRWKFRMYCEGGGGGDEDGDGVPDELDLCPDTLVPELVPTVRLGVNRWALVDGDEIFDTTPPQGRGPQVEFRLEDTGGCSCEQVIDLLGLGAGHEKYGCSTGVMRRWVDLVNP